MIVVCINAEPIRISSNANLTYGKKYEVLNEPSQFNIVGVGVINDINIEFYYNQNRFISLSKLRENKLNKLNIED